MPGIFLTELDNSHLSSSFFCRLGKRTRVVKGSSGDGTVNLTMVLLCIMGDIEPCGRRLFGRVWRHTPSCRSLQNSISPHTAAQI